MTDRPDCDDVMSIHHMHDNQTMPCGHTIGEHKVLGKEITEVSCQDVLLSLNRQLAESELKIELLGWDREMVSQLLATAAKDAGGRLTIKSYHRTPLAQVAHITILHACAPKLADPCEVTIVNHPGKPDDCGECAALATAQGVSAEELETARRSIVDTRTGTRAEDRVN